MANTQRCLKQKAGFVGGQFVVLYRDLDSVAAIGAIQVGVFGGVIDAVRRVGPDHAQTRSVVGPQPPHGRVIAAIRAQEAMGANLPELAAFGAPFGPKLVRFIDCRRRVDNLA